MRCANSDCFRRIYILTKYRLLKGDTEEAPENLTFPEEKDVTEDVCNIGIYVFQEIFKEKYDDFLVFEFYHDASVVLPY
jgi:hypothetical protein